MEVQIESKGLEFFLAKERGVAGASSGGKTTV
jgi:hypothetical protein